MTKPRPRNIAASVHQRLLDKSKEFARPFNELFQYYAIERFLYRLSRSAHAGKFVLKGALMLMVWRAQVLRSTMDIDMLGNIKNNPETIIDIVREICRQEVEADGVVFDPDSVRAERITEDADYEGVLVHFRGTMDTARITIQLDIGFGDVVFPSPKLMAYPTILDLPAPKVRGYSRESMIAEKFEAMVKRGVMSSRMKDIWDIQLLSRQFNFNGKTLAAAIEETFLKRHTGIPADLIALTESFIKDETKAAQWKAFLRKNRMTTGVDTFAEAIHVVFVFLKPVVEHLVNHQPRPLKWKAPGPWQV